jgi:5-methylcytosine-specific restriction endonuclease McrA
MTEEAKLLLIERLAQGDIPPEEPFLNYRDPLFLECAELIVDYKNSSESNIMRRFRIGSERVNYIMKQLEFSKIVGQTTGAKSRIVLMRDIPDLRIYLESFLKMYDVDLETFFEENELEIRNRIQKILVDEAEFEQQNQKLKIKQKVLKKELESQIYLEVLNELKKEGLISNTNEGGKKREPIPQDIMDKVWNRDGGKCTQCESKEQLEFDHIIPFSKGGANTYRNLQILCRDCNAKKFNNIG